MAYFPYVTLASGMSINSRFFIVVVFKMAANSRFVELFRMCLNKSFAMFTSFLGDCHNFCSEFVLDVGKLKEILTAFRNSKKNRLAFFLQIFGIFKNNCHIVKFQYPTKYSIIVKFTNFLWYEIKEEQQKMNNRNINKSHLLYLIHGLITVRINFVFTRRRSLSVVPRNI